MDPVGALSIAAAVVAFLDFGGKVASTYFELNDATNGQSLDVARLASSAKDLTSIATGALKSLKELELEFPQYANPLEHLVTECRDVEGKLSAALQKLTVDPDARLSRKVKKASIAFRSVWSRKEHDELGKRLDRLRSQVAMIVLMCVWYVSPLGISMSPLS